MNGNAYFWVAAVVISGGAVWLTVSWQQAWFRGCALVCLLASFILAARGYPWPSLAAQMLCMLITAAAWHQRCLWMAARQNRTNRPVK